MGPTFVEALPVERFHGVGPATAAKMKELGVFTAFDLRAKDEAFLLRHFGKRDSISTGSAEGSITGRFCQTASANRLERKTRSRET
jgi:DNA polymerase-4